MPLNSVRPSVRASGLAGAALAAFAVLATPPAVAQDEAGDAPGTRVRDLTLDGHEDLLSRKDDGRLVVYPHSGTFDAAAPQATYGDEITINSGWNNADWISTADMTGDGAADVLAEVDGVISVYRHTGNFNSQQAEGTLGIRQQLGGSGWNHFDLKVLADFNGDGFTDIAARRGDGGLFVWATSVDAEGQVLIGPPTQFGWDFQGVDQLDVADIDGDGNWDVVARHGDELTAYYDLEGGTNAGTDLPTLRAGATVAGDGSGVEASVALESGSEVLMDGWADMDAFELKDVNLDGRADLVGRSRSTGELVTFLQTGSAGKAAFGERISLGSRWQGDGWIS